MVIYSSLSTLNCVTWEQVGRHSREEECLILSEELLELIFEGVLRRSKASRQLEWVLLLI